MGSRSFFRATNVVCRNASSSSGIGARCFAGKKDRWENQPEPDGLISSRNVWHGPARNASSSILPTPWLVRARDPREASAASPKRSSPQHPASQGGAVHCFASRIGSERGDPFVNCLESRSTSLSRSRNRRTASSSRLEQLPVLREKALIRQEPVGQRDRLVFELRTAENSPGSSAEEDFTQRTQGTRRPEFR